MTKPIKIDDTDIDVCAQQQQQHENDGALREQPRRTPIDHAVRVHMHNLESLGRGFEHRRKARHCLVRFSTHLKSSGIRFLDEVTALVIQEYLNNLAVRFTPRSVKNYANTITAWLKACVTYGWMPANPAGIGRRGKLDFPVDVERTLRIVVSPADDTRTRVEGMRQPDEEGWHRGPAAQGTRRPRMTPNPVG